MLGQVVFDLPATLVAGHLDKKGAEGNFRGRLRLPLTAVEVANLPAVQGAAGERLGIGRSGCGWSSLCPPACLPTRECVTDPTRGNRDTTLLFVTLAGELLPGRPRTARSAARRPSAAEGRP